MPRFPWPPPRPSARAVIPAARLRSAGTLGAAADQLSDALGAAGYTETGYYAAPGGFALVTRMECIRDDGRPWSQVGRFDIQRQRALPDPFSLSDYFAALFRAPPGRYRLIALVVSDQAIPTNGRPLPFPDVVSLPDDGADRLDAGLAAQAFTRRHRVLALIYEFVRPHGAAATLARPSPLQGSAHLRQAGLFRGR